MVSAVYQPLEVHGAGDTLAVRRGIGNSGPLQGQHRKRREHPCRWMHAPGGSPKRAETHILATVSSECSRRGRGLHALAECAKTDCRKEHAAEQNSNRVRSQHAALQQHRPVAAPQPLRSAACRSRSLACAAITCSARWSSLNCHACGSAADAPCRHHSWSRGVDTWRHAANLCTDRLANGREWVSHLRESIYREAGPLRNVPPSTCPAKAAADAPGCFGRWALPGEVLTVRSITEPRMTHVRARRRFMH